MRNVAFIYQPHFKTNCFKVAIDKSQGVTNNFIIVTCSPSYNGVYKYPSEKRFSYEIWKNGKKSCYCVPIIDCEFVQKLETLKNEDIIKEVKKQQKSWLKQEVTNREYKYNKKPEWAL